MAPVTRIAADIGGTFTDVAVVLADGRVATRKLPSTPASYADAVVAGVVDLLRALGSPPAAVEQVLHGCTVATNAILEHQGAHTGLITTKGFRDVLELQRVRVPALYDPLFEKPKPLVPRRLRLEVAERLDATGAVVTGLDRAGVAAAIETLKREGVEAIAVCFLHSYANDAHEREAGAMIRDALPDRFLSLSVDVLPQKREYERASTTVINAYVGPPVSRYLRAMIGDLARAGVGGRLMVMQSSGGVIDAESAVRKPAQIVECGPAAGVVGALAVTGAGGYRNLITLDMGGTTAKASLIEDGRLHLAAEYEVGGGMSSRSALTGGGGYALKLPVIDISEVGAGGGSLAWLDKAGALKVGPRSAGAVPGPACYGAGNDRPTVTDANVVLGFVNPDSLAGGSVRIDARLAHDAVATIASPLGRGVVETAWGIHQVANTSMMRAVKAVTTYRGRDPRDFAMFAFGGNGGIHAVELARALQVREVIVPVAAGVFSAVGLLFARREVNETASFLRLASEAPVEEARRAYAALAVRVAALLGAPADAVRFEPQADARFQGQGFELTVPFAAGFLAAPGPEGFARFAADFRAEHAARYGHAFNDAFPVEIVNLRLVGAVDGGPVPAIAAPAPPEAAAPEGSRKVHFGAAHGTVETPVIGRAALGAAPRRGPLVIEEYEGTSVVPPDCAARLDAAGNIVIALP
jgi:N-methylhydantoinase A